MSDIPIPDDDHEVTAAQVRRHLERAGERRRRHQANAEAELVGILDVVLTYPEHVSQREAEKLTGASRVTFYRRLEKRRAEKLAASTAGQKLNSEETR